ncbi:hypothetical protein QWY20_17405 [Alkalimonas sp. MEB108]|uniref:Uncharacterized protein n=1 Tax=Alkalimonas cellulosilytica TaxID=3058395 RepID=A0ABU7J9L7_9GAMM|nr:hypothetical protein [Alkalimonas sp. MEB108]MEE2003235.1 hypothetical protein [Alkalimonas sp. MEB108]
MTEISLHKIHMLPFDVPADINLQMHRLVKILSTQKMDSLWRYLEHGRALKFKRKIYALDNFLLLSVLAVQFPNQKITVLEIPVKTETELKQRVLQALIFDSLCAIKKTIIPHYERIWSRSLEIEKFLHTAVWADILSVHRSTLYLKSKHYPSKQTEAVNLSAFLHEIPLPKTQGKTRDES